MKTILIDAVETFIVKERDEYKIFNEMFDLLESFSNPKIIVTNADDEQIKTFGLNNVPYPVFTLKHMPDKPNPEYFKKLMMNYGLTPNDIIYFEHNTDAVKSAESIGIKCYYYDSAKKDIVALKQFLTKNAN